MQKNNNEISLTELLYTDSACLPIYVTVPLHTVLAMPIDLFKIYSLIKLIDIHSLSIILKKQLNQKNKEALGKSYMIQKLYLLSYILHH